MSIFRWRMEQAHQRAALLAEATTTLIEAARDLRHQNRNLRHGIGLLRALRLLQARVK